MIPVGDVSALGPVRVVGTGLLGASVGLALRARGVDVVLADPSPTALALARDLGAGRLPAEGDVEPRVVVVAAPPDVVADVVAAELTAHPDAVVTDVASVKVGPLEALRRRGADLSRYVGGHPMAGRERSGAVAARADLFAGRPWVLTPSEQSSPDAVAAVTALASAAGGAVNAMPPEEHDAAVALVSHVPQVAASLVAARLAQAPDRAVALAGQGLRDVTRIAASDPSLWTQILGGNAAAVAEVLHRVRADLDGVIDALEALSAAEEPDEPAGVNAPGARVALAGLIADGNAGHARIPGKHGAPATSYAVVTVVVPDRPGELARLLREVGEAGVNLEDLHIEHSEGQPVGLAEISVLPGAVATLARALGDGGWVVHDSGSTTL